MKFTNVAISLALTSTLISAAPVQLERRQEVVERATNYVAGIGAGIFALSALFSGLKSNGYVKEAEELREHYGDMAIKDTLGSKEAADEFLASPEGQEFASTMASLEARDIEARGKGDYGFLTAAIISGFNLIRSRDLHEGDLEARGKIDYAFLGYGIMAAFNAVRARSLDEDNFEKRLNTPNSIKWGLGIIASAFAGGSVAKNIATRDVEDLDLMDLIREEVRAEARDIDNFDLLG